MDKNKEKKVALLYDGSGAYPSGVVAWEQVLQARGYDVVKASGQRFTDRLAVKPDLVTIPGGHSAKYNEDLGREGVTAISSYVQGGGTLLGVCGGAYFLSEDISFKMLERDGSVTLKDKKGIGLIAARSFNVAVYDDYGSSSAQFATLRMGADYLHAYYNGGPRYEFYSKNQMFPFLFFEDGAEAGVQIKVGRGRVLALSVHPEYSMKALPEELQKLHPAQEKLRAQMRGVKSDHDMILDQIFTRINFVQIPVAECRHAR